MTGSIFEPSRFSPRTSPGPELGQAEPEPITINRDLADALKVSILSLLHDTTDPRIYTKAACWRDLRSRQWPHIVALQNRIESFLATKDEELTVTDAEWSLAEHVIECVETIGSLQQKNTMSTLTMVGTLVGVAGGVATLVSVL